MKINQAYYFSKYKDLTQEELDKAFLRSCIYHEEESVKYLLTSPELKIHANVHAEDDIAFAHLIGNQEKGRAIIQYLIFDFKIEQTPTIEGILNYGDKYLSKIQQELMQEYRKMFESRDLSKSLSADLNSNKIIEKKNKI